MGANPSICVRPDASTRAGTANESAGLSRSPSIVLCGGQGNDKQALLERIFDIRLPYTYGTCACCPMVIRMQRSSDPDATEARCSLSILRWTGSEDQPDSEVLNEEFQKDRILFNVAGAQAEALEHIRERQLQSNSEPEESAPLTSQASEAASSQPSRAYPVLVLDIEGGHSELCIVDLPPLMPVTADMSSHDEQWSRMIHDIHRHFITEPNAIVVALASLGQELPSQPSLALVHSLNAQDRTLPVLTIPEGMDTPAAQQAVHHITSTLHDPANPDSLPLHLGYYVVRLPRSSSASSSKQQLEWEEEQFFRSEPWGSLRQQLWRVGCHELESRLTRQWQRMLNRSGRLQAAQAEPPAPTYAPDADLEPLQYTPIANREQFEAALQDFAERLRSDMMAGPITFSAKVDRQLAGLTDKLLGRSPAFDLRRMKKELLLFDGEMHPLDMAAGGRLPFRLITVERVEEMLIDCRAVESHPEWDLWKLLLAAVGDSRHWVEPLAAECVEEVFVLVMQQMEAAHDATRLHHTVHVVAVLETLVKEVAYTIRQEALQLVKPASALDPTSTATEELFANIETNPEFATRQQQLQQQLLSALGQQELQPQLAAMAGCLAAMPLACAAIAQRVGDVIKRHLVSEYPDTLHAQALGRLEGMNEELLQVLLANSSEFRDAGAYAHGTYGGEQTRPRRRDPPAAAGGGVLTDRVMNDNVQKAVEDGSQLRTLALAEAVSFEPELEQSESIETGAD